MNVCINYFITRIYRAILFRLRWAGEGGKEAWETWGGTTRSGGHRKSACRDQRMVAIDMGAKDGR